MKRFLFSVCLIFSTLLILPGIAAPAAKTPSRVNLLPANTKAGYLACLLINESAFPGERGWVSEEDTKAAMRSILFVLDSRIAHIPEGYRQEDIAAIRSNDIIDVITAGPSRKQCEGFYRDKKGDFKAVDRVHTRIASLVKIADEGEPGKFALLLNYAQGMTSAYMKGGIKEADLFANLDKVGNTKVTGHAYSWMTDMDYYHPGGNLVKIPNDLNGSLAGNRFYTLKELKP